jgi:hypothetical protein
MDIRLRFIASATLTLLISIYIYSIGWSVDSRQIWLANSPVMTIRNGAGGYTINQRVEEIQRRANDLLQYGRNTPMFTTIRSGFDCNIYADNKFFMTVTSADARANNTTPENLANTWIERLNYVFPRIISLYQPTSLKIDRYKIPARTVIRVTLNKPLNSATSKVGDTFYTYQQGTSIIGFPTNTMFMGRIDSVTRATSDVAGQIGISFIYATLPDGTVLPIKGQLTSLDDKSVKLDPETSRLVSASDTGLSNNEFIASGAGAGLMIGQYLGNQPIVGAVFGSGEGYLYDQKLATPAMGKDVRISAGTGLGILLDEDVMLPKTIDLDQPIVEPSQNILSP